MFKAIDETGREVSIDNVLDNMNYYCPICRGQLVVKAKKSETVVTHFAHKSLKDCDSFSHDMSDWHKAWQNKFPIKNQEVPLPFEQPCHRADVLAYGYVIEFQHSPISAEEFDERNRFYTSLGKKVVWVFDVSDKFKEGRISRIQYVRNGKKIHKYITGKTISPMNAELYEYVDDFDCNRRFIGYQYEYSFSSSEWEWKRPFNTLIHYHPLVNKDIIVFFEIKAGLLQKLIWCEDVIDEDKAAKYAFKLDYMSEPSSSVYLENRQDFVIKSDIRSFSATRYYVKDFMSAIINRQL